MQCGMSSSIDRGLLRKLKVKIGVYTHVLTFIHFGQIPQVSVSFSLILVLP